MAILGLSSIQIRARARRIVKNNFIALTHKDFLYFWLGQCVSLIGTWMQSIGQSWLVLTLTDSPFLLGLVGTLQFLPVTIFSLFSGLIIDRFPKKKILLVTQFASMFLALILSLLVFTGAIRYWHILILAFCLGCINSIDMPTRQSFTVELVGKEHLINAIGLNSATFNLARILGPSIGAFIMAYLNPAWCFLFNGLSFIAVIIGLLHINVVSYVRKRSSSNSILKDIWDGLKYMYQTPILFETLLLVTITGIFAFNYSVLIPVFTKSVLFGSEKTYGFLMSSLGVGSLIGALSVAIRSKSGPKKSLMTKSLMVISIMLIVTGLTHFSYLTSLSLAITGIFNIYFSTTANSTLQINSKDEYRGRVMSVYALVFAGSTPIGNMFAGYSAGHLGASPAFILSGLIPLAILAVLTVIFKNRRYSVNIDTNLK